MFESLHELWFRIRSRFNRDDLDAELAEELRAHAEFLEEEAIRGGASRDEARRAAANRLGNMTNIREATRERWSFGWVEALLQDTKYAFRFLRRSPGFTIVAVLSLALGIGANATVFTVADKLLFSAPAHIKNSKELLTVNVRRAYVGSAPPMFRGMTLFPEYFALKEQSKSFAEIALATSVERVRLGRGPLAPRIKESMVTPNFFGTLGVQPHRGRFLLPDDDVPNKSEYPAVISYGFWKRQFGGADSVIGARFTTTDIHFVVVGVAPDQFTGADIDAVDVWVPLGAVAPERISAAWKTSTGGWPKMLVRLRPGVPASAAEAEATVIVRRIPDKPGLLPAEETVALGSVIEARGPGDQSAEVRVSTRLVIASVLVLIAACANLANLLLVRALTRRREIALRLAIGVTRRRLAAQMLIEALIIALAGAIAAFIAANWGGTALRQLVFPELQWGATAMNVRVFMFSVLCGTAVALIATIAPAIRMTRADVSLALRSAAPQLTSSTGKLRQSLLALQVALSVLLIVGAAAFSKSLNEAYKFDMGIDVDRLATVRFAFESDSLNAVSRLSTLEEAAERVRRIPGVERAAVAAQLPLAGATNWVIRIPERELSDRDFAVSWEVTPDMLPTIGLRLTRGRWFDAGDVGSGMISPVLMSEYGARTLWPGVDPIGRCVRLGRDATEPCHPVVGVIKDLRSRSLHDEVGISMLIGAAKPDVNKRFAGYVVIRAKQNVDVATLIQPSRTALLNLRNDISNITAKPIASALDSDYRPLRLGAVTFGSFALLAVLLSAVGLYGILSFSVTQRTGEFGIRSALGARASHLVSSVVREGMAMVVVGMVIGMALSWYASTAIAALLFQSSARDAAPYVCALVVLGLVALAASIIPALRATRVDPATALRAE